MQTDNQKNRVSGQRLKQTTSDETITPLDRLMLDATNLVIAAAMREGIEGAMQESTLLAEAVATSLDTNPEAAAELHGRIGHMAVDYVLDSLQRQRLAS